MELLLAVGPDVYRAHQEDTERYVLTNLNMVSVPCAAAPWMAPAPTRGTQEPLDTAPHARNLGGM